MTLRQRLRVTRIRLWLKFVMATDPFGDRDDEDSRTYGELAWDAVRETYEESPPPGESPAATELTQFDVADLRPELEARRNAVLEEILAYGEQQAAARRARRRVRRRRLGVVTATAILALGLAVGGTTALGLEVPVVDEVIGAFVADREAGSGDAPRHTITFESPTVLPGVDRTPGKSTSLIEVPVDGTSERFVAASYVTRGGDICLAASLVSGGGEARQRATGSCTRSAETLRTMVGENVAFVTATSATNPTMVLGYTDARVEALRVRGPEGFLTVALSPPWTPDDRRPFRVFLGVAHPDSRRVAGRLRLGEADPYLDFRNYDLIAHLRSGRTVKASLDRWP